MNTYHVTMMIPTQVTVRAATPGMAKLYARNMVEPKTPIVISDQNDQPHRLEPKLVCIELTEPTQEPSDGGTAA